jgi:undecaprenyl-diphosphatase
LYQISAGNRYGGGQYSFVSSHAANFFAITTCFFLVLGNYFKKFFYLLVLISIIVCFSRIYLGVHYLSDVFAGGLLGIGIAVLTHHFVWKNIN